MSIGVVIILLFLFIPLVVGFYAGTKAEGSSDDYFIQGRAMGSIAVFFTVAATWWSAFAFLGSNASFYTSGPIYLTAFAWNIFFGYLYFVVGKRVWFLGKKFNYVTPSDLLGEFYNSEKMRILVGFIVVVFTVPYLQFQLSGGAYLIQVASGAVISFWLSALLFYVVILISVWVGGMIAVAWPDSIYGALLFFGLLFAGFYIAGEVGGARMMFEKLSATRPEHLTRPGSLGDSGYAAWISLCFITAIGALMGPQLWLRMYAVKEGKLFNLMPFLITFVAISYIGSVLVGWTGVLTMSGVENADQILPLMITEYAPFVIGALVLSAGAAAAMSTANSQIHAVSAIMTKDLYQRYSNPNAGNEKLVQVGRYFIVLFSVVAYFLALFAPGVLVAIGLSAFGGTAQLIVPTVGALFWQRSNAAGGITGLLAGTILMVLLTFVPGLESPFGLDPAMWGLVVNTLGFVIVSVLTPSRDKETVQRFAIALEEFKQTPNHPEENIN